MADIWQRYMFAVWRRIGTAMNKGGRGRRRIVLPTYPFERQRYWIDDLAPVHRHRPGRGRTSLLGRSAWKSRADPGATLCGSLFISLQSHPWIADHRVQGVVILPMTAYLEMMSAALSGPVSEVVIREPLIVPDGVQSKFKSRLQRIRRSL